jgi:hypothetical protein
MVLSKGGKQNEKNIKHKKLNLDKYILKISGTAPKGIVGYHIEFGKDSMSRG